MISIVGGAAVIEPEVAERIARFEREAKAIKKAQDELKAAILAEMEDKGLIKVETDAVAITYVAGSDRETFDSKRFRADNPDMYDDYVTMKPVKPSVRIRVK
jgi:hypothetical protein